MLKLKLQYFGHLMWRADSFEKTLMLGKIEGRRRRGYRGWDGWMASPTQWTWVWINSGSWWWTGRPGVLQSMGLQRVGHDWVTELNWMELYRSELLPLSLIKYADIKMHRTDSCLFFFVIRQSRRKELWRKKQWLVNFPVFKQDFKKHVLTYQPSLETNTLNIIVSAYWACLKKVLFFLFLKNHSHSLSVTLFSIFLLNWELQS